MKFRIDLKILFFLALFYLTRQLKIYLIVMLFAFLHEISHLIIGLILGFRPQAFEMMPFGFSMNLLPKQKHELEINFPQGDANNQLKINFPQKNEFTTNISYKIAKNKKNTLNENFIELKYIFVALAGPIFNLIIAGVLYKFDFGLENELRNLIFYSNILLCIFNLVPLYPLDGGRVAIGILNIIFGRKKIL